MPRQKEARTLDKFRKILFSGEQYQIFRYLLSWFQGALHACVNRIKRRRAADVQSVSLLAAEAQISHRLGYVDLADQLAVRRIAADAVLVRIAPADGAPNAAVPVGA